LQSTQNNGQDQARTNKIARGKWTIEALEETMGAVENGFKSL
jgi:hypothetical protein